MPKRPQVNDRTSFASRFRRARFALVEELIRGISDASGDGRVRLLDVGGRRDYWTLLSEDLAPKVSIVILNNEEIELETGATPEDGLDVTYELGDARAMPQYADGSFDLAHSNSVIEHVGSLQDMAAMADETRRVAPAYYVQTPYLWFPMEPHYGVPFFHWLPVATRAQLGVRFKVGYRAQQPDWRSGAALVDHTTLIDQAAMRALFPDAEHRKERFALMTKSLIAFRRGPARDTAPGIEAAAGPGA